MQTSSILLCFVASILLTSVSRATPSQPTGQLLYASPAERFAESAVIPGSGAHELRIITPTLVELYIVSTREGSANRPTFCDWIDDNSGLPNANLPTAADVEVKINGTAVAVTNLGFQRRVRYAPLNGTLFHMENALYLELASAIPVGGTVTATNPATDKWPASFVFTADLDPNRWSSAVHVNQVGYEAGELKKAHVGKWLGSLGELSITATTFDVIKTSDSSVAATGPLSPRADSGFLYTPAPYQQVYEADFSSLTTPGEYRLRIPGLGASFPFEIRAGIDGVLARTTVAGLFHQRSAQDHALPYTRYEDGPSHTAAAEIPSNTDRAAYATMWDSIQGMSGGAITGPADLLYPYVNTGSVDVSGGHMDAGDYSKYSTNTAAALHALTFAVDYLPNVADLDNLGIPESDDSVSDLLQEAHYAADFLTKMQDADGGFYYIVRPKDRDFETDVLPSAGDTQVVYPKNTISTAVATAALAEIAASPAFQTAFPAAAASAEAAALAGWNFLMDALDPDNDSIITPTEKAAAYQKIAFYGDAFTHDDELAWAAAAMFVMTEGEPEYESRLKEFMPDPNNVLLNGWRRLFEGWGGAMRTYAFGIKAGRITNAGGHDAAYLTLVENELKLAGDDVVIWTNASAYGAAMPLRDKEFLVSAYHFSGNESFDALVASLLNPSNPSNPDYREAVRMNANYALGNNPNDIPYYTGLGWRRQREIVSQFAHNDTAVLPPVGIPIANISQSPPYLDTYLINGGNLLQRSLFPAEGLVYPFYERWTDTFDVDMADKM
ncbi:MAG: glycoside hydrolase family 9 protein, partial [Verrucomicrobiae bacterium]|nr:glycoside hydrolase family 9 protein [Verrucomicrobiae bacterium]